VVTLQDHMFTETRQALGPTMPIATVRKTISASYRCLRRRLSEIAWNTYVHSPMIDNVFRLDEESPFIDSLICRDAKITPEYLVLETVDETVDFGLFIDPAAVGDEEAVEAMVLIRADLSHSSINHTEARGLKDTPLWFAIKTGTGYESAELSLRVWLSSHFQLLERLVRKQCQEQAPLHDGQAKVYGKTCEEAMAELPFLPGAIVQGTSWRFVAMTRDVQKRLGSDLFTMNLWGENEPSASTADVRLALVLETILRVFGVWARRGYWPWFRKYALGLENTPAPKWTMEEWIGDNPSVVHEGEEDGVDNASARAACRQSKPDDQGRGRV
jgi:hypothetical protein